MKDVFISDHQFPVNLVKYPSGSKIPKDNLRLFIHRSNFCLLCSSPPKVLISWNISDLRRYGIRDGKFCFEGGSKCGKGKNMLILCLVSSYILYLFRSC